MAGRRVAVIGAAGQLGRELVGVFSSQGDEVRGLARPDFDITRRSDLERLISLHPDVVINAAAWTDVDGCARDPQRAMSVNGLAAGAVAEAGAATGALSVQISSNEVFDGSRERPYAEGDETNPINPYGASKLAGEQRVAAANPRHLIVRTAWIFSPGGSNFVTKILAAAQKSRAAGVPLRVVNDEWGNPTPAGWLAAAVSSLIALAVTERAASGVFHLAGWPPVTRFDWAVALLGEGSGPIVPVSLADYPRDSRVPKRAVLDVRKATALGIAPADWAAEPAGVSGIRGLPDRLQ